MTREQKKQKRNEVLTIIGLMALLIFTTRAVADSAIDDDRRICLCAMAAVPSGKATRTAVAAAFGGCLHQFRRKRYWPTHFRYCRGGSLSRSLPGTLTPNGFGRQQMPGSVLKRAEN